jgi:hypothetical protein
MTSLRNLPDRPLDEAQELISRHVEAGGEFRLSAIRAATLIPPAPNASYGSRGLVSFYG